MKAQLPTADATRNTEQEARELAKELEEAKAAFERSLTV